jgi:ATP-dependent RNA helicase SUPV3L1/SUV3
LEGFRFTADVKAEGPDAKAVKGAAQKALAAEYDRRAERFSAAANGDFALGSDGILRWVGAPVATLVAGDSVMRPRSVLLADEQLTGASREKVQSRIDRFVAHHIETVLKPLHDLTEADALTGMTRGLAFRLVESFGVIQRRDIAEEIRGLDQDSRAALRRFGVRFGAYHVFIPALLKPAPAGLMTLLWALSNDGRERAGYGDVVHVLAAGRTSVVVEPDFDTVFYTLAGYRVLGRRAVRFDILERLADLIRPALAWRPGAGLRAEGAYDGARFMVTPSMMSILGATPEDMEEVLKSLGYRHEALEAPAVAAKLAELDAFAEADAAKQAGEVVAEPAGEAAAEVVEQPATEEAPVAEAAAPEATAEAVAETSDAAAAEEPVKMVLLWRPGRHDNRPREQNRNRPRPQGNRRAPAKDGAPAGDAKDNAGDNQSPDGRSKRFEKAARVDFRNGEQKSGRNEHQGKPRHAKRDHGQDQKRVERNERPVQIDPDSPFAKLLALKEQLKK